MTRGGAGRTRPNLATPGHPFPHDRAFGSRHSPDSSLGAPHEEQRGSGGPPSLTAFPRFKAPAQAHSGFSNSEEISRMIRFHCEASKQKLFAARHLAAALWFDGDKDAVNLL
jgi:hypothetical protein